MRIPVILHTESSVVITASCAHYHQRDILCIFYFRRVDNQESGCRLLGLSEESRATFQSKNVTPDNATADLSSTSYAVSVDGQVVII